MNIILRLSLYTISMVLITNFTSCLATKKCYDHSRYFVSIDTTKPYNVEGVYCISKINTSFESRMIFNVFDRISGVKINNGIIWINDENKSKINIVDGYGSQVLLPGIYVLEIASISNTGLKTKKIKIKNGEVVTINIYLGQSLQF